VVGGKVFGDFDYDGLDDQPSGLASVKVYLYGCSGGANELLDSTTTDAEGHYFFSGLTDGVPYRVEFVLPANYPKYYPGFGGGDSQTSIQFVTAPDCTANAAFTFPADYCQADPPMAATCFVNGDPLADGSESAALDVVVGFDWSSAGNSLTPDHLATAGEVGAVYGLAWDKSTQTLYASAFIKRHVGLGPLGIGGIYRIEMSDPNAPVVSPFVDVEVIGIDVGSIPSNAARGLPDGVDEPSNDPEAYGAVAKQGIGAIAVQGGKLWLVNLHDGRLYSIVLDSDGNPATPPTAADVASFAIPDPGCSGGSWRPFAVSAFRERLFVGGVCDAALSQDTADLSATVYEFVGGSFEPLITFPLSYPKGYAASANECDHDTLKHWQPWLDVPPGTCDNGNTYVYPQPVLADIAVDIDGSLILGFMDRTGHQIGHLNYPPTGTSPLMSTVSGGDLLRVWNDGSGYVLESNGSAGPLSTMGAGNMEGPGGGEVYFEDLFAGPADNIFPVPHAETAQGDLAFFAGAGEVAVTSLDPYSTLFNSGGINWMSNYSGEVRKPSGYVLYRTSSSTISTFSKANGLGGLALLCAEASPPIQIGTYVWQDDNSNGTQDACEPPLAGIQVQLFDEDGTLLATKTTDATGQVFFDAGDPQLDTLLPHHTYFLVAGSGGQFDPATGKLNDAFFLTLPDAGDGHDPDQTDSDAAIAGNGLGGGAFAGLPYIAVTTGEPGWVSHSSDFGFAPEEVNPTAGIGGFVWDDENQNGLQDAGEGGIGGVTVRLFSLSDVEIAHTTTDAAGNYFLFNVSAGDYYLAFDPTTNTAGIANYQGTLQDQGADESLDSDADPANGQTAAFTFDPTAGDAEFDAGFYVQSGTVGGRVWEDSNADGIRQNGEPPLEGVTVTLYDAATDLERAQTTTDADGFYSFGGVTAGNYYLHFNPVTNAGGVPNYQGVPQDQGADDSLDSDADPATGNTSDFAFDPVVGNIENLDAGFHRPADDIAGSVWLDLNEDGLQDPGEPPLEGVTVTLREAVTDSLVGQTTTDAAGNYRFPDQFLGTYYLHFDPTTNAAGIPNLKGVPQDQGADDNLDSDADPLNGHTSDFVFDPLLGPADYDAGFYEPRASIGGRTWHDLDEDGLQSPGEPGIEGVTVQLFAAGGSTPLQTVLTGPDGAYVFEDVPIGDYLIQFDPTSTGNASYEFTTPNAGDDALDSDADPTTGRTEPFSFDPESGNLNDVAAGFTLPFATVGGRVWLDCDRNGLQDPGEDGLPGILVTLSGTDNTNNPVNETLATDGDGRFLFDEVAPGVYSLAFGLPSSSGWAFSPQDQGSDEALDSDADPSNGQTPAFTIEGGEQSLLWGAGLADVEAPVFVNPPADETLPCDDPQVSDPPTLSATDNFDPDPEITFDEVVDNGGGGACNGGFTITRTWTATDRCGNTATHVQVISTGDNVAPFILNIPDLTVECDSNIVDIAKAVDDCDPDVDLVYEDIEVTGSCPTFILRKWTATDDCGNVTMNLQKITLLDTTPPELHIHHPMLQGLSSGAALTLECDESDTIGEDAVSFWDNCDTALVVSFEEQIEQGDCPDDGFLKKRTLRWSGEDRCGNAAEFSVTLFTVDSHAPEVLSAPPDLTVDCRSIPAPEPPLFTDNCDDSLMVVFGETLLGDTCQDYKIVRLWSAMDDCANMTLVTQTIVVETGELTLSGVPDDLTIECDETLPPPASPEVEDPCDETELHFVEQWLGDDCNRKLVRTWTATNDCGDVVSESQIIFVIDTTPPAITLTHPMVAGLGDGDTLRVDCADIAPLGPDDAAATDNCFDVTMSFMEMTTLGDCPNQVWLDCCWKAEDICGNQSQLCITVVIDDEQPPVLHGVPDDLTVDLSAGEQVPPPASVTATDNCDDDLPVQFGEVQQADADNCGYTLTRTWRTEDDCGNETIEQQVIVVEEVCDCPDILIEGISVEPAKCGLPTGSVTVNAALNPGIYEYHLIPNFGSPSGAGNVIEGLPAGSYLLVVTLPNVDDCEEKIFFDVPPADCADTLAVTISGPQAEVCLDSTVLDYPGVITSAFFCDTGDPTTVAGTAVQGACVTLVPAQGYLGTAPGLICVVHCFNGSASQCDTTYLEVTVEPEPLICNLSMVQVALTQPDCEDEGGRIVVSAGGNVGALSFQWEPPVSTSNFADGLSSGSYAVTVTDALTGCQVDTAVTLTAPPLPSLEPADLELTHPLCGGQATGAIVSVSGTEYLVSNGQDILGATPQSNLPAGTYLVIHSNAQCETTLEVELQAPPALEAAVSATPETCAGQDGSLELSVSGGTPPYSYEWAGGLATGATATGLSAGTDYAVTVVDALGCSLPLDGLEVPYDCANPTCNLALSLQTLTHDRCGQGVGAIELAVSGGHGTLSFHWSPMVSTGALAFGLSAGTYEVRVEDEAGCSDVLQVTVEDQQPQWQYDVAATPASCAGDDGLLELSVSGGSAPYTYQWSPDVGSGPLVSGLSPLQSYSVTVTDQEGCTLVLEDLQVGSDCPLPPPTTDTLALTHPCNLPSLTLCLSTEELSAPPAGLEICGFAANGALTSLNDTCFSYQPFDGFEGEDEVCLEICDQNGRCDRRWFRITVLDCSAIPCDGVLDAEEAYFSLADCDQPAGVCLPIPLDRMLGYELLVDGQAYAGTLDGCDNDTVFSYSYLSLPGSGFDGPYELLSWSVGGQSFSGTFADVAALTQAMNAWDPAGHWQTDTLGGLILGGSPSESYGDLVLYHPASNAEVTLGLSMNFVPQGTVLQLPAGEHELVIGYNQACYDTLRAHVVCAEPKAFFDTLEVGQSRQRCLPLDDLPGALQSVDLSCTDCGSFALEAQAECLNITGLFAGEDAATILLCDDLGICQEFFLYVRVEETARAPLARNDTAVVAFNTPLRLNLLQNDELNGNLKSLHLLTQAANGSATLVEDYLLEYVPATDFCGEDGLAYEVCNEFGCDQAQVRLSVECLQPRPYEAFSPNNDGLNDAFVIEGLERFGQNELIIFNRWGKQVFHTRNYDNDWKGTYRSADLPDGTYFYYLRYGEGRVMTGFVEIRR